VAQSKSVSLLLEGLLCNHLLQLELVAEHNASGVHGECILPSISVHLHDWRQGSIDASKIPAFSSAPQNATVQKSNTRCIIKTTKLFHSPADSRLDIVLLGDICTNSKTLSDDQPSWSTWHHKTANFCAMLFNSSSSLSERLLILDVDKRNAFRACLCECNGGRKT
jgi:hypothetical protein